MVNSNKSACRATLVKVGGKGVAQPRPPELNQYLSVAVSVCHQEWRDAMHRHQNWSAHHHRVKPLLAVQWPTSAVDSRGNGCIHRTSRAPLELAATLARILTARANGIVTPHRRAYKYFKYTRRTRSLAHKHPVRSQRAQSLPVSVPRRSTVSIAFHRTIGLGPHTWLARPLP